MAMALRPRPTPRSMISRYGSHALAAGARPGGGHGVTAAVESVDAASPLAGFDGAESVDTPLAVAGFDGGPTCRGALIAIEAARRYALAVSRRMPVAPSIFLSDQPSRPSASTCCFFSSLKTLAIPARELAPIAFVNVPAPYISWPGLRCPSLAGFGCPPRLLAKGQRVPPLKRSPGLPKGSSSELEGESPEREHQGRLMRLQQVAEVGHLRFNLRRPR